MSGRSLFRKPWSQPLADFVTPCLAPALSRFGFDEADLLLFWPEIVGERLASRCEPLRLQWPPRGPRDNAREAATLIVQVEGAFAIELQHQSAVVIARVNGHVGWRCVGRLALRQGPLGLRRAPRPAPVSMRPRSRTMACARPWCASVAVCSGRTRLEEVRFAWDIHGNPAFSREQSPCFSVR